MMNFKKYPKYKNSGIAWLGDVPEHWEVRKAKWIFDEKSRKGFENEPMLAATQKQGVVLKEMLKSKTVLVTKDFHTLKLVEKGDFVISLRSFQGGIEFSYFRGIISPAYTILKPKEIVIGNYFKRLLKDKGFISNLKLLVKGIREGQNIDTGMFENSILPIPPKPEQTAIANFLDYKLEKIDRFITKKKQLIELLNEQKAAIINQAVTKGVPPNYELGIKNYGNNDELGMMNDELKGDIHNSSLKIHNYKDSGIEWLGDIPESWEVKKLKYVANCFPSNIDKHSKENEETVRLCNYTDVYKNDFITNEMDLMIATAKKEQIKKFSLLKNDVIITKDSETADDIANPALVIENLENVVCGYHLSVLRPYKNLDGGYLFRALQCKPINVQFELCSLGVTRVGLGVYDMKSAKIPVPPISEQKEIFNFIQTETKKIEKTISTIAKEIALVEEYKTALIAEAVTGKIDVRNYEL